MNDFSLSDWIKNPNFCEEISRYAKSFECKAGLIGAELKICGLGWYVSYINGVRTDDQYFKPLISDYGERTFDGVSFYKPVGGKKRVYYNVFDISRLVSEGENTFVADVAGGWFHHCEKQVEGNFDYGEPRIIFEITLNYGSYTQTIGSDCGVTVCNLPYTATIFKGERRDFTAQRSAPAFAEKAQAPSGILMKAPIPSDKIRRVIPPCAVWALGNKIIYDFGVNHTGFLTGAVHGKRGDRLIIVYGEEISPKGHIDHTSTSWGTQIQQDEYILSGKEDKIDPEFTYHGYRYAEISTPDGTVLNLYSAEINAALKETGEFDCSNEVLLGITRMFKQTMLSNMHGGVPSDCPHRERRGYTGDGWLTSKSAMFFFDAGDFYRKWYEDILDSLQPNGYVPHTAPYSGGGGGYAWGYAVCSVAENLYEATGDLSVIRSAYPAAEAWVGYMNSHHGGDYIILREEDDWSLGDWFAPDNVTLDKGFVCTCFFYKSISALVRFGKILGKPVGEYEALARKVAEAVNKKYYDSARACYAGGEQGADALALEAGIVPEAEKQRVVTSLVQKYRRLAKIDTGIFCIVPLFEKLTEAGETGLVYRMLTETEYPSYGYMLENGATTLWECWAKERTSDFCLHDGTMCKGYPVSKNHPMFGSVCEVLVKYMGGLDLCGLMTGKRFVYKPMFTAELERCKVSKQTSFGTIAAEYRVGGNILSARIEVPAGIKADVYLPIAGFGVKEISEGVHEFCGTLI